MERGVSGSDRIEQPTAAEVVREATAQRAAVVSPRPSPTDLPEDQYNRTFLGRHVFTSGNRDEMILGAEKLRQELFCRNCREEDEARGVTRVTRLHVSYEKDPLRAVGHLCYVRCHHCLFEMHIPMKTAPDPRSADEKLRDEVELQRKAAFEHFRRQGQYSPQQANDLASIAAQMRVLHQTGQNDHANHLARQLDELRAQFDRQAAAGAKMAPSKSSYNPMLKYDVNA